MYSNLLLVFTAFIAFSHGAKLPKTWKTCKRYDPKKNECLKVAVQGAMEDLMKGVPSLGVLPLDPLHMSRLELDQGGSSGPVAINLTFMNVDFHGFKSAKLDSVDIDWDKKKVKGLLILSEPVVLLGDYAISGKVLVLPITGQGKCNFTLKDVKVEIYQEGSFIEKKGKTYFHSDVMKLDLKISRVYMRLENLFNGDKALGDNMNKFLDENWAEVYQSFQGTLVKGLASAYLEISNRVFDRVPFDIIAPL